MATQPAVPIIVGVGDLRNKSFKVEDAVEPAQLMVNAVRRAVNDSGLDQAAQKSLLSQVDSLRVVPTWTWAYNDLPGVISHRLGIKPTRRVLGEHGGNQPALQCDEAARDIAARRSIVSVLTGGEALASRKSCPSLPQQRGSRWLEPDPNGKQLASLDLSILKESSGTLHSMGLPIHVYPLYENGRRAHRRLSATENSIESAQMYAEFDRIGSENEYSWNYQQPPKTAEQIGLVSKKNRMICDPYPLLMNAFNGVNLSAACILTSTENAKQLGIPQDKWIYVLGGAGTHEKDNFWERRHLHHSEAIAKSIDAALDVSGLSTGDIDCYDFYSCFPIVPKLACDHVGLSTTSWQKPITLLGGLTSFGGAGNNYSMHAITAMARELRAKRHNTGLILANGGMLTHQHALCLSARPRGDGRAYPTSNPLPEIVDGYSPRFAEAADGTATIETYTIEYNRDGTPGVGLIVGRLRGTGQRFLANHGDDQTLSRLATTATEHIGKTGRVRTGDDGRNLFFLDAMTKL
ncbi:thiolase [Metarhizium acridum CQMa 102]|uniref:Thiolase n=1 Tax=Metarhizium acridum (strain CQMa 102) TaxID=655827 RepID=E9EAD3_METAQ|nr:thiolase [Metarhizium acridum CQMa 102]EFY87154.1 thiolase [Metarhizium acridum CQMa 102]